ncbi:suprabasin isoform X1 [Babesia caballi]|uniref:Suprabasin isoform X1 n=1 Tax=Babesia caballi TaxID=5871 RepID=A0AAV4LW83_BABCB|nr:suprabasin isoform X1 [Babesia caballi]
MGYSSDKLNININGEIVMTNVAEKLDELSKTSDSASPKDYRAFLQKLEANAPTLPINHPLCSLHILATKYFNSQSQLAPAKQIIKTINIFKEKLIEHSIREESSYFSSSDSGDYDDLKEPIINLLSQVAQFKPDDTHNKHGEGVNQAAGQAGKEGEKIGRGVHHGANQGGASSAQPSSAGPVAATLTTLGLGGGAAAAYIFNLGGAKTLINGLLRIG